MNVTPRKNSQTPNDPDPSTPARPVDPLRVAAGWAVVIAASWFMLGELASLIRPLALAVFVAYLLLPAYSRLRHKLPRPVALGLLAGVTIVLLVGCRWPSPRASGASRTTCG